MDDLISRQAAIDSAERESQVDGAYGYMDTKSIVDMLNNLPSAQPDIVRCKDCKYFDSEDDCGCPMDVRYSDFFCKMGERRTDGEIIHQYHERQKEVLKEMSMPVGRNVMDALRERRRDETD